MKIFKVQNQAFSNMFSKYCNLEEGPWIAGGSVRKIFEGKPWEKGDVDFFFKNPKQWSSLKDQVSEFAKQFAHFSQFNSRNATTFYFSSSNSKEWISVPPWTEQKKTRMSSPDFSIQLIHKMWHPSATNLINQFDLGICQFVTDGNVILATDQAINDTTHGIIKESQDRSTEPTVSPMRLTKYCAYGFEPDLELLKIVLKRTITNGYSGREDDY